MLYEELEQFCIENHIDLAVFSKNIKGEVNHSRLFDDYGNFLFDVYFKYKKGKVIFNTILNWKSGLYSKINSLPELSNLLLFTYNIKTNINSNINTLF